MTQLVDTFNQLQKVKVNHNTGAMKRYQKEVGSLDGSLNRNHKRDFLI